jgi:hypothetical protein
MTPQDARSKALEMLAEQGFRYNWPGHVVVWRNRAFDQDAVVFAIPDRPARNVFDPDQPPPNYYRVCLEARWLGYRFAKGGKIAVMWGYANTDADWEAFLRFVDAAATEAPP